MRTILYLGLRPPDYLEKVKVLHHPLIKIVPRAPQELDLFKAFQALLECTHLLFTSKSAVQPFVDNLCFHNLSLTSLKNRIVIAIGVKTMSTLRAVGISVDFIPHNETQEGIIELLQNLSLNKAKVFLGHSNLSRTLLFQFFQKEQISLTTATLYNTVFIEEPIPSFDFDEIQEIHFTSPSTVDGFFKLVKKIPPHVIVKAIGPITAQRLQKYLMWDKAL
jgi:uroporphyrinogen-III synthase